MKINFLIINGTAGTGKSHTICGISTALGREDVIRGSVMAKASFLIRGFTLHSLFSIPVEAGSRSFVELKGDSLKKIQDRLNKVLAVIIDEYSMVSLDLLGKLRANCVKLREDET